MAPTFVGAGAVNQIAPSPPSPMSIGLGDIPGATASSLVILAVCSEDERPDSTVSFSWSAGFPVVTASYTGVPPSGGRRTRIAVRAVRGSQLPVTVTPVVDPSNTHLGSWRIVGAAWRMAEGASDSTATGTASQNATTLTTGPVDHRRRDTVVSIGYASQQPFAPTPVLSAFQDANGFTERFHQNPLGASPWWFGEVSVADKVPGDGSTSGPTWGKAATDSNGVAVSFVLTPRRERRGPGLMR